MAGMQFEAAARRVLLAPGSWRLVCASLPPEAREVPDRRHRAWMVRHVDHHPAREVLVALRGRGVYGCRGRVFTCAPGTVMFFDAYEPHDSGYAPRPGRLEQLWVYLLGGEAFARLRRVADGRILPGAPPPLLLGGEAAALLAGAWDGLAAAAPAAVRRARLVAALAVVLAEVAAADYTGSPAPSGGDLAATVIGTIRRHVEAHAGRGIPLAEAARLAGYSKFHFARLFRRHTGQTYHAYVDACRTRTAQRLLREGCRKKDLAATLGFSHASALLRWMRRAGLGAGRRVGP